MKVSAIKLILLALSALCLHSCNDVQNTEDDLTNDSDTTKKSSLNCFTDSGITDTSIPKPIIKLSFQYTTGDNISYRSIKDKVSMNLINSCVSDPASPDNCLENWRDNYYIKYKWEITESPTPLSPDSQLKLPYSDGGPGQWIYDCTRDNPKRAEFAALKVTPVRSEEENSSFDEYKCAENCGAKPENSEDEDYPQKFAEFIKCHQKYCEKFRTKYYKVNVQAVTADKNSGNISATSDVTVIPRIIPAGRVQVQLSWKQGYRTKTESDSKKDGTQIDLDLHLIKRTSLEADSLTEYGYERTDGVLGTNARPTDIDDNFKNDPEYWRYFLHDDCSFSDKGAESPDIRETIKWQASLDLDNTWGGNNFETPETINLGPVDDKDRDGIPDKTINDDQYLVVVGYVNCTSKYEDKRNACDPDYKGDGAVNEVDARVEIMVDGVEVPRNARGFIPADNFSESTKNFKIKYQEWKVVAVIKWDSSLAGPENNPKYQGSAIVSDVAMAEAEIETDARSYKTCRFNYIDAVMVPVWNKIDYYTFVESQRNPDDPASEPIGECY